VESIDAPAKPVQAAAPRHVLVDLIWSPSREARIARRVAIALSFLFGLSVALRNLAETLWAPQMYRKDFLQEYVLARAIAEGANPYLPIPVLAHRFLGPLPVQIYSQPTPHPPTVGLLLLPLAFLDYPTAAMVWLVLEVACLLASIYLLGRIAGVRLGVTATLTIAGIALMLYPVMLDLSLGQLMLPILVLLAGAVHSVRLGRGMLGGALVGISMLLKPVAWPVLLVFVVRGQRRALASAFSVVLAGYAAAVCAMGATTVFDYLTRVLPLVTRLYHAADRNISIWTVGWRLFDGMGSPAMPELSAPPLVQSAQAAAVVSAGLPAFVLIASVIVIRKQRSERTALGLMVCVSILVSPISWTHYLVLAAVPAVRIGEWLIRHRLPSRETNVAVLVAITLLLGDEWTRLAFVVGKVAVPDGTALIPFWPALFTLGPAVAVAALAVLLMALPDLPGSDSQSGGVMPVRD
jgi:hypothetical protein